MVNNSTNVYKTNNHLKSLYIKKNMTYDAGNSGPVLGKTTKIWQS